jgi:hypothetical protein
MVSYVIPVYNQAASIREAVDSAAACAQAVGGEVVVSVNLCEDDTPRIVDDVATKWPCVRVRQSPVYLSAADNLSNALNGASRDYVVMLGGDDTVPVTGHTAIAQRVAAEAAPSPAIYFGEVTILHATHVARNATSQWYRWQDCTPAQSQRNILAGRYPNINGTWIPRTMFYDATRYAADVMGPEYVSYAGDAAIWWWLSQKVRFVYCPVVSIEYRVVSVQSPSLHYKKGSGRVRPQIGAIRLFAEVMGDKTAGTLSYAERAASVSTAVAGFLFESAGFTAADQQQLQEACKKLPVEARCSRLLAFSQRWPGAFRRYAAARAFSVRLMRAAIRPLKWLLSPPRRVGG